MTTMIPDNILLQFTSADAVADIRLCKFGHINGTYVIQTRKESGERPFILQRINHHVFRDPQTLMSNIMQVTTFLREKIMQEGGNPDRETLTLIPTQEGRLYLTTPDGDYWRAYRFITGARSYMQAERPEQLFQAARAFGRFLRRLDDFPTEALHETIPDFHHTPSRFQALMRAVDADPHNRAFKVRDLIELAQARADKLGLIAEALERGDLPQRVTHNDTKFNNVLLDDITGEGVCVVDLDTVMPGTALYDFGDFVNTATSTGAEDERNLNRIQLNLDFFDAIARGFLQETRDALTSLELTLLPLSGWLITFELAMRFLTDHINGDRYFRIHRPNHNLDRARSKFKLASEMEAHEEEIARIIARYS